MSSFEILRNAYIIAFPITVIIAGVMVLIPLIYNWIIDKRHPVSESEETANWYTRFALNPVRVSSKTVGFAFFSHYEERRYWKDTWYLVTERRLNQNQSETHTTSRWCHYSAGF